MNRLGKLAFVALIVLHAARLVDAARRLAPTWDEIAYAAAGWAQLKTGSLDLNTMAPYLGKLIYALPLLALHPSLPLSHPSFAARDAYRFGFEFIYRNTVPATAIIFASRIPVILASVALAVLIGLWIRRRFGWAGALTATAALASTPILISRGTVAQLEMPAYVCIVGAVALHARWFQHHRVRDFVCANILVGGALLFKMIALPLIPAFAVLNLLFDPSRPPLRARIGRAFLCGVIPVLTVVPAYLPWRRGLIGLYEANWLNVVVFDKILPYYWAGRMIPNAPSLITWLAVAVKAPIFVVALAVWGAALWFRSGRARIEWIHLVALTVAPLLSVLFFRNAVSTIQLSPAYLGVVALGAGLALLTTWKTRALAIALVAAAAVDASWVHPNYLSYFNPLAGGTNAGVHWLADSDQDWGHAIPLVAEVVKRNGNPAVLLAYSGAADPEAHGLPYQDVLSPALVSREHKDTPIPVDAPTIWLAVGTKVLQSVPDAFQWLLENRRPRAIVGGCYFLFDISADAPAFRWLSEIYKATNRPPLAKWANDRASWIEQAGVYS